MWNTQSDAAILSEYNFSVSYFVSSTHVHNKEKSNYCYVFLSLSCHFAPVVHLSGLFPPFAMVHPSFLPFNSYNLLYILCTVVATIPPYVYTTSTHFSLNTYLFLPLISSRSEQYFFVWKWQSLLRLTLAHKNLWENLLTFSFTYISSVLVYLLFFYLTSSVFTFRLAEHFQWPNSETLSIKYLGTKIYRVTLCKYAR